MKTRLLLPLLCFAAGACGEAERAGISMPNSSVDHLTAVAIVLPDDPVLFSGPDADLLNRNCLACHSTSMIQYQPRLSAEQWRTVVFKMRDVYKAPIAEEDLEKIVTILSKD